MSASERKLIDRAALASGKASPDFVLEAAHRAAEETLLDRVLLCVGSKAYAAFLARLDASPQPNERLHRTLKRSMPWDKG